MRLAEFKMRLLVFFAGALRKWAGSIEPTALAPRKDRDERLADDVAEFPAESRRASARPGPPEHWSRLVASTPPDHWLDLIRSKAPHLLSPEGRLVAGDSESVSAADESSLDGPRVGPTGGALEPDRRPGAFAANNSATDEHSTPRSRGRSRGPRDSSPQVSAAKWLNRLRFRLPKQRPMHAESLHHPDSQATTSAEYGGSASEVGADRESPLWRSERYDQSRELTTDPHRDRNATTSEAARRVRYPSDKLNETAERSRNREIDATGASQHGAAVAAGQYRLRDDPKAQTSSAASSEAPSRRTVADKRLRRTSNVAPTIFVERPETNSAAARSRSAANSWQDTGLTKQPARSEELDRESSGNSRAQTFAGTREDERSSSRDFNALGAERSAGASRHEFASEQEQSLDHERSLRNSRRVAVERSHDRGTANSADARVPSQSRSAESLLRGATTNAATRGVEHPRHRFASTDFATPALSESSESMWPTLPPSRNFEITDELAALEREAETLRRLDREQRGTLWNA